MITADDGKGGTVTDTFSWNVTNPGPTATDDSFTTDEDTPISGTVATNDGDPDGDSLTYTQTSSPSHGTLAFNNDGTFTFTPAPDYYGTDTFTYQVTDADGATSTATVTITIDPVNDAPVVDSPVADQTSVDSDVISLDVSGNFSDIDSGTLTFSATGLPPGLSISAAGSITGTLDS